MSRFHDKDALSKLLRDSIVQLCRVSVGLTADFELDAIICVSTPRRGRDDDQQIVVKVHESFACRDGDSSRQRSPQRAGADCRRLPASMRADGLSPLKRRRPQRSPNSDCGTFERDAAAEFRLRASQEPSQDPHSEEKEYWPVAMAHIKNEPLEFAACSEQEMETEMMRDALVVAPVEVKKIPDAERSCRFDAGSDVVRRARCGECNDMFVQRTTLSRHVFDAHGGVMTHFCDACSVGYATEEDYSQHCYSACHKLATVGGSVRDEIERNVNANQPNRETGFERPPDRTTHDSAYRIPDDLANWTTTEQTDLATVIDLSDDAVAVDICGSDFVSKMPDGSVTYRCDTCERVHASFAEHSTHVQCVHLRCACPHCGRTFSQTSSRNRHVVTAHLPSKLFECRLCNTSYTRAHTLRKHCERAHYLESQTGHVNYSPAAETETTQPPRPVDS